MDERSESKLNFKEKNTSTLFDFVKFLICFYWKKYQQKITQKKLFNDEISYRLFTYIQNDKSWKSDGIIEN